MLFTSVAIGQINYFSFGFEIHNKDTQNKSKLDIPGYGTAAGQRTFHYRAASLWNSLPERLAELTKTLHHSKQELMRHFEREC